MKTYTTLKNLATNLTNNTSTANDALMGQLISDQQRYLIEKWFDNERSVTFSTVGSQNLTATGSFAANATSGTLTSAWTSPTGYQLVNFSNGNQRNVLFTNGSAAISWTVGLSATATTALATLGMQYYNIPADVSKIKNNTISIGQLKYQPVPVQTRQEWDNLTSLPYNSDIPNYFFIYSGTLGIFPIPSTTGNVGQFNYKGRVPDFSFSDYSTGNITAATAGSTSITGSGTLWSTTGGYPLNTDLTYFNLFLRIDPPYGDGLWYQIRQFNSATSLTLVNPIVNAPNITASSTYTIGQLPVLQEDFHDMIVYGAVKTYFSSINKDMDKFKAFDALYQERLELLKDYAGTKSQSVDLGDEPLNLNPNLFIYAT